MCTKCSTATRAPPRRHRANRAHTIPHTHCCKRSARHLAGVAPGWRSFSVETCKCEFDDRTRHQQVADRWKLRDTTPASTAHTVTPPAVLLHHCASPCGCATFANQSHRSLPHPAPPAQVALPAMLRPHALPPLTGYPCMSRLALDIVAGLQGGAESDSNERGRPSEKELSAQDH